MTRSRIRSRRPKLLALAAAVILAILALFGGTASTAQSRALVTITVDTLPIANALPMDLGIKKGFFQVQGIEITKRTLQSGNDIVLALANHNEPRTPNNKDRSSRRAPSDTPTSCWGNPR